MSLLLLSVCSFFLGGARASSTSLRCLSFHHNCTAGLASQLDKGGPVVAIRSRLSRRSSPTHVRLFVFITLSWENTHSTWPLLIGRQSNSSIIPRMLPQFLALGLLNSFHQTVLLSCVTKSNYRLAWSVILSHSSCNRDMLMLACSKGTLNRNESCSVE